MAIEDRWIRLQCNYLLSGWLETLGYPCNRLWSDVLTHTKLNGNNRGSTKALSAKTFARLVDAPEEAVSKMLDAAIEAQALIVDGDRWVIARWSEYQSTEAERMRRARSDCSEQTPLVTNNNDLLRTNATCSNGLRATETETETETETREGKARGAFDLIFDGLPVSHQTEPIRKAVSDYLAYRSERRLSSWKQKTIASNVVTWATWRPEELEAALRASIANAWQGVFFPKPGQNGNHSANGSDIGLRALEMLRGN